MGSALSRPSERIWDAMRLCCSKRLRKAAFALASCGMLALAIVYAGPEASFSELARLSPSVISLAFLAIIASTAFSALRFRSVLHALGYRPPLRSLIVAFTTGHVSNAFLLNVIGQSVSRAAVLKAAGTPTSVTVAVTIYERVIAAVVLGVFALSAAIAMLSSLDLGIPLEGPYLLWISSGLAVAASASVLTALTSNGPQQLVHGMRGIAGGLGPSFAYTVASHVAMLAAWVVLIRHISGASLNFEMASVILVVMFASSLPISLSGWGVRELTAAHALSIVGIAPASGLAAGIALGLLTLVVVVAVGLLGAALFLNGRMPVDATSRTTGAWLSQIDLPSLLIIVGILGTSILLFFNVRFPTGTGEIRITLADFAAVLAVALGILSFGKTRSIHPWPQVLVVLLLVVSGVLLISLCIGYLRFGLNDWAIWNRTIGWGVIVGYVVAGGAFALFDKIDQAKLILKCFLASGLTLVTLQILGIVLQSIGVIDSSPGIAFSQATGFTGNPNAYAIQLITMVAVLAAAVRASVFGRPDMWMLVGITLIATGMYFTYSRTGYGMLAMALLTYFFTLPKGGAWSEAKTVATGLLAAVVLVVLINHLPDAADWVAELFSQEQSRGHLGTRFKTDVGIAVTGPDQERWDSLVGGWTLWQTHPIFGAGLGAQVQNSLATRGQALVIHCTPLWLLAETGLVGFLAISGVFTAIFVKAWRMMRDPVTAGWGTGLLILLVAIGSGSVLHDFFFQRFAWFFCAAFLALGHIHGADCRRKQECAPAE